MKPEQLEAQIESIPAMDRFELEARCRWLERAYAKRVWSWGKDRAESFREGFFCGIGAGLFMTMFAIYWIAVA